MLRRRRLTTAAQLAERLEVSERTVYRDIRDLSGSGVPILGEAGVGYRLGKDFDLPPLMCSTEKKSKLSSSGHAWSKVGVTPSFGKPPVAS